MIVDRLRIAQSRSVYNLRLNLLLRDHSLVVNHHLIALRQRIVLVHLGLNLSVRSSFVVFLELVNMAVDLLLDLLQISSGLTVGDGLVIVDDVAHLLFLFIYLDLYLPSQLLLLKSVKIADNFQPRLQDDSGYQTAEATHHVDDSTSDEVNEAKLF